MRKENVGWEGEEEGEGATRGLAQKVTTAHRDRTPEGESKWPCDNTVLMEGDESLVKSRQSSRVISQRRERVKRGGANNETHKNRMYIPCILPGSLHHPKTMKKAIHIYTGHDSK